MSTASAPAGPRLPAVISTLSFTSHPPGGFGVSEESERPARAVRNPATGAEIHVAASSVPEFRAGADFKALVNGDEATQEKKPAAKPARKR